MPRRLQSPPSPDPTLGELVEAEAAGAPIPADIQAALAPLTRLFQDIRRTLRWDDKRPGPRAACMNVAAGPRALALALMPFAPVPVPPAKNPPPGHRTRHSKAYWQKLGQEVRDLQAKGKKLRQAEHQVARNHDVNPGTLHARIHGRKARPRYGGARYKRVCTWVCT